MMAGSRNFYKSLLLSSPLFSPLFRFFRSTERERLRVISRGWVDSSLINGFKVSLIESNFLVLPVILIRRETENGYLNFFSLSFFFEISFLQHELMIKITVVVL